MGRFYRPRDNNSPIWVYSERGVLNFTFCAMPNATISLLLDKAINANNRTLAEIVGATRDDSHLLTEFDLGSDGFGSPDNGLHLQGERGNSFVFIEAKAAPIATSWQDPQRLTQEQLAGLAVRGRSRLCGG